MTLDLSRQDESRFQPAANSLFVTPLNTANSKVIRFGMDKNKDTVKSGTDSLYLLRMALAPGQYSLRNIFSMASAFPINCTLDTPLLLNVTIEPNSVQYLGRIKAIWRKRQGDEFRAGPVLPLISQAACGAADGSFDVSTSTVDSDIALFKAEYPALKETTFKTSPLPEFNRARAQSWWENNGKDPAQ